MCVSEHNLCLHTYISICKIAYICSIFTAYSYFCNHKKFLGGLPMASQNAKKKGTAAEPKYPLGLLLPIIAVLSVIPLITYMYSYETKLGKFEWYTSQTSAVDFFLHTKLIWFLVACACMIFCLVYMIFADEQKAAWCKILIPLAIYCGISFISALASSNRDFCFSGIYEQFEPVWALMGYCLTAYYCFFIMRTEAAVKRIMPWFVAGITVMVLLGLSQALKHDFFRTSLGQKLMTPSTYKGGPLKFNFEEGRTYLSLYNPNYVGFYVCLIVPILVGLIFAFKKVWAKIGCAVLIVSPYAYSFCITVACRYSCGYLFSYSYASLYEESVY